MKPVTRNGKSILPALSRPFLLCLGALPSARAWSAEMPEGVRYTRATDQANAQARSLIEQTFSGGRVDLTRLLGAPAADEPPLVLGPFMGIRLSENDAAGLAQYQQLHYQVEVSRGVKVATPSFFARDREKKGTLAARVEKLLSGGTPVTIRKPTNDELALIWYWISWDIAEPIYTVEAGGEKLILNFEPGGSRLVWIEDIRAPCFTPTLEGRPVTGCHCMSIAWQGLRWSAVFRPVEQSCRAMR